MSLFRVKVTQGDSRTGDGSLDSVARRTGTITAASNATPIVITSATHGLSTGMTVIVKDVAGNTAANSITVARPYWTITVLSADTFSLDGSTGDGAYTSGGTWLVPSVQRSMYVPGPNKINREMNDGVIFSDCNYYKQFTYPTMPYNEAFIETVSDDGSIYEFGVDNTFPTVYSKTLVAGTTYTTENNIINILELLGGPAKFTQITTNRDITVQLNESSSARLPLEADTTQIFNSGDLSITHLAFDNSASGATTATVTILVSVVSTCNS